MDFEVFYAGGEILDMVEVYITDFFGEGRKFAFETLVVFTELVGHLEGFFLELLYGTLKVVIFLEENV